MFSYPTNLGPFRLTWSNLETPPSSVRTIVAVQAGLAIFHLYYALVENSSLSWVWSCLAVTFILVFVSLMYCRIGRENKSLHVLVEGTSTRFVLSHRRVGRNVSWWVRSEDRELSGATGTVFPQDAVEENLGLTLVEYPLETTLYASDLASFMHAGLTPLTGWRRVAMAVVLLVKPPARQFVPDGTVFGESLVDF